MRLGLLSTFILFYLLNNFLVLTFAFSIVKAQVNPSKSLADSMPRAAKKAHQVDSQHITRHKTLIIQAVALRLGELPPQIMVAGPQL